MRPPPRVPRPLILTARLSAAAVLVAALVGLAPQSSRGDMITIVATSTGKATAGPHPKGGMSSAVAVKSQQDHISAYDGETKFVADYTINYNLNGSLNTDTSTVTFKTVYYTSSGKAVKSNFTTEPITITAVYLDNETDKNVIKFDFASVNWYDKKSGHHAAITDKLLTGSIDLVGKTSSYVASYSLKSNGVISTFTVEGESKDMPADPLLNEPGPPDIFSPVPEPTSLALMATGAVGLVGCRLGRARRARPPADLPD